jgi:hypothetical protein
MKWIDIRKQRPPFDKLIWVWDDDSGRAFLVHYLGSEEVWNNTKNTTKYRVWAYLNEDGLDDRRDGLNGQIHDVMKKTGFESDEEK